MKKLLFPLVLSAISLFLNAGDNTASELHMVTNPNVLFVGNSIMVPVYNLFISDSEPYNCTNIAFSGASINQQQESWNTLSSEVKKSFDFILLEVGINSINSNSHNFVDAYQEMVNDMNASKKEGCKIIAATLTPAKAVRFMEHWFELNEAIRGEGPNPITGIDFVMTTNTTELDKNNDYYLDELYNSGDGIHPNNEGKLIIKNNYLAVLRNFAQDPVDPDPIDPPVVILPAAPSDLKIGHILDNEIQLSWKDNSAIESHFYLIRYNISNPSDSLRFTLNSNDTSARDNTVLQGTTYSYRIQAVYNDRGSGFSNTVIAAIPSSSELKRNQEGLVAFYNMSNNPGFVIYDVSGIGDPVNMFPQNHNSIVWNEHELTIDQSSVFSSASSAKKIIEQLKVTNELTIECWIKPDDPIYSGIGRILSLNENENNVGFVLDQHYNNTSTQSLNYSARLNTSTTIASGYPELQQIESSSTYISMHDITFVRNSEGYEFIYVDGKKTTEGFRPGNFSGWSEQFRLRFGNSSDNSLPWKGSVYMIAIYSKALSQTDISKNYEAGPHDKVVKDNMKYDISLSPNPVSDIVTINVTPQEIPDIIGSSALIRLINSNGYVIFSEELFNPAMEYNKTIDLSNMPSGYYFLQLICGKEQKTVKFIKY